MKKRTLSILCLALCVSLFTSCENNAPNETSVVQKPSETAEITSEVDVTETTEVTEETSENQEEEPADDEEDYSTGDASLDNIRNQDGIGEKELLVLSFGTSFNDSRRLTIGAIEQELEDSFADFSVRRGFTSNIIIDHVNRRDGFLIDDIEASLKRAVDNGVKTLVVQPTHLMNGIEYDEIVEKVAQYSDAFEKVVFGEPLLTSDEDFKRVELAITDWTKEYDDGETAICFMGHGTEAESNKVYTKLQDLFTADGFENYFIGTVEAAPTLDDVLSKVKAGSYKRVILQPLMVVAGDHANNDMAGDEEDSWKTAFEKEGYTVECLLRGLGENEAIRSIYVDHAQTAINTLS